MIGMDARVDDDVYPHAGVVGDSQVWCDVADRIGTGRLARDPGVPILTAMVIRRCNAAEHADERRTGPISNV
jgi:hypothetical protein